MVVPEILKGTVLEFCHSKGMAGHMGIDIKDPYTQV